MRPAAGARSERDDLFGGGQTWIGEGDCFGERRGRLFRRRRAGEGSGGPIGAAVWPGGDSNGDPLDLVNRQRAASQEADHKADADGDAAIAVLPASDGPRADAKQLGNTELRDAKHGDRRAEFGLGHGRVVRFRGNGGASRQSCLVSRSGPP